MGHFNSVCVSADLGARTLLNTKFLGEGMQWVRASYDGGTSFIHFHGAIPWSSNLGHRRSRHQRKLPNWGLQAPWCWTTANRGGKTLASKKSQSRVRKNSPKFSCIKFFQIRDVPTQIPGHPGHSLSKTTEKGHLHRVFVRDIPTSGVPDVPGISCPKTLCLGCFFDLTIAKKYRCVFKSQTPRTRPVI